MSGPAETATQRLGRLLTLVPWLLEHQGVPVAQAASTFGVTPEQIEADLALLFLCGTPGHLPDDLIEADWQDGRIFLANADSLAAPLRLTVDEALTLMVGLQAIADTGAVPGPSGPGAVTRALSKLESAVSQTAAGTSTKVRVDLGDGTDQQLLATVSGGLSAGRRLRLTYLVPSRDESTVRDVDPMRVVNLESRWYLEGWCHRAEAVRLFRIDRIAEVSVLDVPSAPPPGAAGRDLAAGAYLSAPSDVVVELAVAPSAAWVTEYYPADTVTLLPDGTRRMVLRTADPSWVVRLVWRLGGAVRVVAPVTVAQQVRSGAAEALSAYQSSEQGGIGDPTA